jgi:release factor glutamine methyltransferase
MSYVPGFADDEVARLRRWHERAYTELLARGDGEVSYLGLHLTVPAGVFAPTPVSDLLGEAVLAEAGPEDRVLDMGTGSGVNAILAARNGAEVAAIDIVPEAVRAARMNAARNGVESRIQFMAGDLFAAVRGPFDLIIYDPPFRWFRPRDSLEIAMADEGYRSLTRFMRELPDRLTAGGRALLFFGTSGDLAYLTGLIDDSGLSCEVVAERELDKDGTRVIYRTYRLTGN